MAPPTAPRTYRVMSRREVAAMISEGHTIVVIDQHVLKLDSWLKYHPGGEKAIMHLVGRDATDEVRGWGARPVSVPSSTLLTRYRIASTPRKHGSK